MVQPALDWANSLGEVHRELVRAAMGQDQERFEEALRHAHHMSAPQTLSFHGIDSAEVRTALAKVRGADEATMLGLLELRADPRQFVSDGRVTPLGQAMGEAIRELHSAAERYIYGE
jgi:hypothetical protein